MQLYGHVYTVTIKGREYCASNVYYFRNYPVDKLDLIRSVLSAPFAELQIDAPHQELCAIGNDTGFTSSEISNIRNILRTMDIYLGDFYKYTIIATTLETAREWRGFDDMTMRIIPIKTSTQNLHAIFEPKTVEQSTNTVEIENTVRGITEYSERMALGFDTQDVKYYREMFEKLRRRPRDIELFDLGQSNSEHSRHHFFRGNLLVNGKKQPTSLFSMVKQTNKRSPNSLLAFCDNSSVIRGYPIHRMQPSRRIQADEELFQHVRAQGLWHPVFTAETHNFPTSICPFPGASTGVGGRLRDVMAVGRGGIVLAGTVGYCVGDIYGISEQVHAQNSKYTIHPKRLLIEASNGASFYANNFGEPCINGFCRSYAGVLRTKKRSLLCRKKTVNTRVEWCKCIMFSGGVGLCHDRHVMKEDPKAGDLIVMLGGAAYRIGLGGGSNSSNVDNPAADIRRGEPVNPCGTTEVSNKGDIIRRAVQRADPEMEQKLYRVMRGCIELGDQNPIRSVHDQGAGGPCNCIQEIVCPRSNNSAYLGAFVDLSKFRVGDTSMSPLEIWCSEFQEVNVCLVARESIARLLAICEREDCPIAIVGCMYDANTLTSNDTTTIADLPPKTHLVGVGKLPAATGNFLPRELGIPWQNGVLTVVHTPHGSDKTEIVVQLPLNRIVEDYPRKTFKCKYKRPKTRDGACLTPLLPEEFSVWTVLENLLGLLDVGSKRFLCNKVDRSVTGLVVAQPCVGPYGTPICDYGLVKMDFSTLEGICTANGEQPLKGMLDVECMGRLAVAEMLTNMVWVVSSGIRDIKISTNWMWSGKTGLAGGRLAACCRAMSDFIRDSGMGVDGGKDSLSMNMRVNGETVVSPDELVISGYVTVPNIYKRVEPYLLPITGSVLLWVKPNDMFRMGGSQFGRIMHTLYGVKYRGKLECPDVGVDAMVRLYNGIQYLIDQGMILAGHDVSDGGVITTIIEMMIAAHNVSVEVRADVVNRNIYELFSEEIGVVIQVKPECVDTILSFGFDWICKIGAVCHEKEANLTIKYAPFGFDAAQYRDKKARAIVQRIPVQELRKWWEAPSVYMEADQVCGEVVDQPYACAYTYHNTYDPNVEYRKHVEKISIPNADIIAPRVAVVRAEGCNGDRELADAFLRVGFEVYDVCMTDIHHGLDINQFRGLAFCGGFSYMDVLGAGRGWAMEICNNTDLCAMFQKFYMRTDTFSFGVCNGAQMMLWAGLLAGTVSTNTDIDTYPAHGKFVRNLSEKFESRWVTVMIEDTERVRDSVMLRGMGGNILGVWVAHGEGRYMTACPNTVANGVIKYSRGTSGTADGEYPFNPNSSMYDIAGLLSDNGRHLCMMPHPERCIYGWQMQYRGEPVEGIPTMDMSPWIKMFMNAYEWTFGT